MGDLRGARKGSGVRHAHTRWVSKVSVRGGTMLKTRLEGCE